MQYKHFIPQNVAVIDTRRIGILDASGTRVGQIPLNGLVPPIVGQKVYSFGAISDVHITLETAEDDFKAALTYLNDTVDFICISGDLTYDGSEAQLGQYKAIVDAYAKIPVYAEAGNHEHYTTKSSGYLQNYTGYPLYFTVEQGNDVFIFVGTASATEGEMFAEGELQWLYETLEANRNKRCFLFEHILPVEGCGDVLALYPYAKMGNSTQSQAFKSLLRHYKNLTFLHGHTHMKFHLQEYGVTANYDHIWGCHSVHVPSLAVPRDVDDTGLTMETIYAASEGYVVDVYPTGIHLRGRDFVAGEFLPIASYWLDTTLQEIPAGTYTDPTGTITT